MDPELEEKMRIVDERVLTCPHCKSQNYTVKRKMPWYRRCKCNDCGKYFVRYDYNDRTGTEKAPISTLTKDDIVPVQPYGYNVYKFYAVTKSSGNLHYASAYDSDFDDDGIMTDFSTTCGRSIRTEDNPDWPKKWSLYPRTMKGRDIEHEKVCLKCRKIR